MKYILSDQIALRSWRRVPYAYYIKNYRNAQGLKKEEYLILSQCDGNHNIEDSPLLQDLIRRGFCRPASSGEVLAFWQKEMICDNLYFPALNWMITGKCNYNCLHCFNAADNARLQGEFTLGEAKKLIKEAQECGINAFTITGGEPMVHPHFIEIIREIYAHGMYINELNTNGHFITKEILDEMKSIGCLPLMKISFDGIGDHGHDWLRNRKGAEEDALRAMKLCIETGFQVKVQVNVHRLNVDTMLPTAWMLRDMGVSEMRLIRTTELPRWEENAKGACLTIEEYFDAMIEFLREYVKTNSSMIIDIWNFATVWPESKSFTPRPVEYCEGQYRDSHPVCRGNRGMVAVSADGNLYPCLQLSGYYMSRGWFLGNVKEEGLKKFLQSGDYLDSVCTTVGDLKEKNSKCAGCKWFKYCAGGCRLLGLIFTGDVYGADKTKCIFFEEGYTEKLQEAMPGFYNIAPTQVSKSGKII